MKHLKTFKDQINESKMKDWLHDKGTIFTGKPEIWEITSSKAANYTKKIVDILIKRGYELTDESGTMTDGKEIWALTDDDMQPIVITWNTKSFEDKYDKRIFISVGYYFPNEGSLDEDIIEIDVDNLEKTADNVANSLEKFRKNNHTGNVFSKQGSFILR